MMRYMESTRRAISIWMINMRMKLEDVNETLRTMRAGEIARSVLMSE